MKRRTHLPAILALSTLLGLTQAVRADGCGASHERAAAAQLKAAEELERAGKLEQAFHATSKIDAMCLAGDGYKRHPAMRLRLGLQLGQIEEKQGRWAAAFNWYSSSRNDAEADRVMIKHVTVQPADRGVVGAAIHHFQSRNNPARVAELRQLAARNADRELASEESAFASRKDSLQELGRARDWLHHVGDGALGKMRQRAELRGDTLAREDIVRHLENARSYYRMADAKAKEAALKEKALRLARAHEKKGEVSQAREFYRLAGAGDQGQAMQERADARHRESEAKRQQQFKKGQDSLEKELGL